MLRGGLARIIAVIGRGGTTVVVRVRMMREFEVILKPHFLNLLFVITGMGKQTVGGVCGMKSILEYNMFCSGERPLMHTKGG